MNIPTAAYLSDRRLAVLVLSGLLALALGFFTLSADHSLQFMIYGGYWAMLLITALFGLSLFRLVRADWLQWREQLRTAPRWPLVLIGGCGLLLLVHEDYGFKILMDEAMLLGTSMSLHFEKMALVPMRGHDIQGAFQILGGELDKRPLLQPFLVSLLHDFTGYRPENAFVLNTLLTFVLLGLAYACGRRLGGRGAGAVGVLLLTTLPLLAQNATGGGFELLNLVMILSTLLLAMRWVERRDAGSQEALVLSAVLLALTRYESVLFLLPVALLILWIWWRERRPVLSWTVVFSPLLLVPYALHNRVFRARESAWELASQPGYERPFSPAYVPDNLAHALNFFFDTTGEQSNSLLLAVLGFIALPFFVLWMVRTLPRLRTVAPAQAALAVFALGFAAHTALLMGYFWGRFDDPVIRRLSLPLNLWLVLAIITVAAEFRGGPTRWRVLAGLALAGLFGASLPSMARHDYSLDYYIGREIAWRREFMAAHPEKDYLFIDNSSIFWITHRVSATPMMQTVLNKESLLFNHRNHTFSAFYVYQRLDVNPETGELTVQWDDVLGPDYRLETVWERRFTPLTVSRISRVVEILDGEAQPPPPPVRAAAQPPAERERIRREYLDNFIKQLP
ncbi:MAG: hypothetical protein RLZZ129_2359 [Verrucomicrobiota bacterium]|jgi:hypothetical protein